MKKLIALTLSHALVGLLGVALGIYLLPILTAPPSPSEQDLAAISNQAVLVGQFRRDLKDSDALHWGEGTVMVSPVAVSLQGQLAPGPDYQLYLSPKFVETESEFLRLKPAMAHVGPVKTFENFVVALPNDLSPESFQAVIVWCESFGQFITAAKLETR